MLINAVLAWAWWEARYSAAHYRTDRDYWHHSAIDWRNKLDDLRRNCVRRDPRTGRYTKKGY